MCNCNVTTYELLAPIFCSTVVLFVGALLNRSITQIDKKLEKLEHNNEVLQRSFNAIDTHIKLLVLLGKIPDLDTLFRNAGHSSPADLKH